MGEFAENGHAAALRALEAGRLHLSRLRWILNLNEASIRGLVNEKRLYISATLDRNATLNDVLGVADGLSASVGTAWQFVGDFGEEGCGHFWFHLQGEDFGPVQLQPLPMPPPTLGLRISAFLLQTEPSSHLLGENILEATGEHTIRLQLPSHLAWARLEMLVDAITTLLPGHKVCTGVRVRNAGIVDLSFVNRI